MVFLLWWAVGAVSILGGWYFFERDSGITLADLLQGAVLALTGPIPLVVGIIAGIIIFIETILSPYLRGLFYKLDKIVLIRRRE